MSDNQHRPESNEHLSLVERMSFNLQNMQSSPRSPQTPTKKVVKRSVDATPGNSTPVQFSNRSPSNNSFVSSAQPQLSAPPQRPQSGYGSQAGSQQSFAIDPQLRGSLGYNNNSAGPISSSRQTSHKQQSTNGLWKPQQPYFNQPWQPNGRQPQPHDQVDTRTQQRSFTDQFLSMSTAPLSGGFNNSQPNQSFSRNFQNNAQNNFHKQARAENHPALLPSASHGPNRTPRISSLPTTSSSGPLAGQKRRLATPSPERPSTTQVYLQNNDHPAGITLSVPRPAFMSTSLYLPSVQPRNPNTTATASTLRALALAIQVERYDCALGCRNKGTCVHYHFVLGARRTPDGLICKKCHEAGELNLLPKAKRVCPVHYDAQVKGALVTLMCDYLATAEQRVRMVEIVERAWRNDWVGRLEGIKYASPAGSEGRVGGPVQEADEDVQPNVEQVQQRDGMGPFTATSAPAPGQWSRFGTQQGMTLPDVDTNKGKGKAKALDDHEGELLGMGMGMGLDMGLDDNEKTPQPQPQPQSAPAAMQSFVPGVNLGIPALPAGDSANYGLDDLFLNDADFSMHGFN